MSLTGPEISQYTQISENEERMINKKAEIPAANLIDTQ